MNFTVMQANVEYLPEIARLAQELQVRLYLNLATDSTFLFRADEVAEPEGGRERRSSSRRSPSSRTCCARTRRWLPRYSDLRYMRGHFSDLLQKDLPCAESQLKLMIHSRGEIGGCWGHDPKANIRVPRIADVDRLRAYRDEHAKLFRKECVGLRQQLQPQPAVAADELRHRPRVAARGRAPGTGPPPGRPAAVKDVDPADSIALYDAIADGYDEHFSAPHRKAYDDLAWKPSSPPWPS